MRRGFKKWAEEISEQQRKALGLRAIDPLPARRLAKHLRLEIVTLDEAPGLDPYLAAVLLEEDGWSAVAFRVEEQDRTLLLHNTGHSLRRQESDIMHEIAHLLCEHKPTTPVPTGAGVLMRQYDDEQEEEAGWLGGCLQIPTKAIMWAARKGMGDEVIAEHFGASVQQVQFRKNVCGVRRRLVRERGTRGGYPRR